MQICNQGPSEESDHDLLQRVTRFLDERGCRALGIELDVEQRCVVVHGRVPSYYMRQLALECIKRVAGVTRVIDRISVANRHDQRPSDNHSEHESGGPKIRCGLVPEPTWTGAAEFSCD